MGERDHLVAWVVAVVAAVAATVGAADDVTALTHGTPGQVQWRVTADGLSLVQFAGRAVARGGWRCFNAEGHFKAGGSGKVDTAGPVRKSIAVLGLGRARVVQHHKDISCTYDYAFDGEDLRIEARVENRHGSEPMNIVGFRGLEFHFDRSPVGMMYVQHVSYFRTHGVGLCHPGHWAKIGGSYATDGSIGVGTSPAKTGLMRTLTLWDYADWRAGARETLPRRRLIYYAVAPVPPRGARTFAFRLRVSPNRDWRHLLEPYRRHFVETFGPVRYRADHRWIATDYLNHSQRAISPTNPYGFHGGHRRIDTDAGVKAFCETVLAGLKAGDGQGVIVWGQGGDDPRRAMYRPDFDILPPEVQARWPTIARRFAAAKRKLGVCTRPRHLAVRKDWTHDQVININPDDPGHRAMIWRRFENMIAAGCTLFYLDSFGSSFEDVRLMQFLREKMGPEILTFAEHQCDAILPYSGGYSETTFAPGEKGGKPARYRLWSGLRNWEIYQFLAPASQMTSRLYQGEKLIPKGFRGPDEFFFSNRISPLIPVGGFKRLETTGKVQAKHITAEGTWREPNKPHANEGS